MTEAATPHISRRPALPLIWVVPILALVIAGWMIARQFRDRGPLISIEFSSVAGIEAGKTELEHKGVSVGVVKGVALKNDLSGVLVQVRLTKAGGALARAGSQFWVVHPQVSITGVSGLETLVSGVRLQVRPGNGPPAKSFRGLDQPPAIENPNAGRAFVLKTDELSHLNPGTPVYYRGIKVGSVETSRLSDDATAAMVRIRIFRSYVNLVRTNTEFWDVSGFTFHLGLHGAEIHNTSLQSLLTGGIAFATPDQGELAPPALEGTEFRLHPEPEKEWLKWAPRIPIQPVESTPDSSKPDTEPVLASQSKSNG